MQVIVIGGFARQLFLRSLFSIVCRSISSLIYRCIVLFYFSIYLFHMISCCTLIILKLDPAEDDHEKERISVEEANRPFPVPKDGITFESLIRNRDEVEYFKEFLNKKHNRGEGKGLEGEGGGRGFPLKTGGVLVGNLKCKLERRLFLCWLRPHLIPFGYYIDTSKKYELP